MKVSYGSGQSSGLAGPTAVSVGNFDGVHLGHQVLLRRLREKGEKSKLPSVVMTFDPHPLKVLFPERGFKSIFDLHDRIKRIADEGIDHLIIEPFSRELSERSPEEFFQELLVKNLKVKDLTVGYDFTFGKDRTGTLEVLKGLCVGGRVGLEIVPPFKVANETVSSSQIRRFISEGSVAKAKISLGRSFYVRGVVEKGEGRGRKIGFPTANLFTRAELLPKIGVYVTSVELGARTFKSVTNVGRNPTFQESPTIRIETHIIDFDENIYGETLSVFFHDFLRHEKKFNSVPELVSQIGQDVKAAEDFWNQHLN